MKEKSHLMYLFRIVETQQDENTRNIYARYAIHKPYIIQNFIQVIDKKKYYAFVYYKIDVE